MMMAMLQAGGMPLLTDHHRQPDTNNPMGYYEYERVKQLPGDTTWLQEASGHAVKVISRLLADLPKGYPYRVIFMEREIGEIVASQSAMLARLGQASSGAENDRMMDIFSSHLTDTRDWLSNQSDVATLYVSYNDLMSEPTVPIAAIDRFLGGRLDVKAMSAVVDRRLYRERDRRSASEQG